MLRLRPLLLPLLPPHPSPLLPPARLLPLLLLYSDYELQGCLRCLFVLVILGLLPPVYLSRSPSGVCARAAKDLGDQRLGSRAGRILGPRLTRDCPPGPHCSRTVLEMISLTL